MKHRGKTKTIAFGVAMFIVGWSVNYFSQAVADHYLLEPLNQGLDQITRHCDKGIDFCTTLYRQSDWDGLEDFSKQELSTQEIKLTPIFSKRFPEGRMFFLKKELGMNFQASIAVRAFGLSEAAVPVELKNLLRCIIGDGDYRSIKCEYNKSYPENVAVWSPLEETYSKREKIFLTEPTNGIKIGSTFYLDIRLESSDYNYNAATTLNISYLDTDSTDGSMTAKTFSYIIPIDQLPNTINPQLGFGVLDAKKIKDNSASFGELKIKFLK